MDRRHVYSTFFCSRRSAQAGNRQRPARLSGRCYDTSTLLLVPLPVATSQRAALRVPARQSACQMKG